MAACCGEAMPGLTAILGSRGSARWASWKALSCGMLLDVLMGALPAPSSSSMELLQSIPCQGLGMQRSMACTPAASTCLACPCMCGTDWREKCYDTWHAGVSESHTLVLAVSFSLYLNFSGPSGAVGVGGASEMLRRPPGEMQILIWLSPTMLLTPLLALTGVACCEVPMQP